MSSPATDTLSLSFDRRELGTPGVAPSTVPVVWPSPRFKPESDADGSKVSTFMSGEFWCGGTGEV